MSILFEKIRGLNKPRVVLRYQGLRFEGIVVACDDNFLELFDDKRNYTKFLKLSEIDDLQIREISNEN